MFNDVEHFIELRNEQCKCLVEPDVVIKDFPLRGLSLAGLSEFARRGFAEYDDDPQKWSQVFDKDCKCTLDDTVDIKVSELPVCSDKTVKCRCSVCGYVEFQEFRDAMSQYPQYMCGKCREPKNIGSGTFEKRKYQRYVNTKTAKTKGFGLTFKQFSILINSKCFYCGLKPSDSTETNGVDRINSDYGYSLSNCLPCCTKCNHMKLDMTVAEFILRVGQINHHIGGSVDGILQRINDYIKDLHGVDDMIPPEEALIPTHISGEAQIPSKVVERNFRRKKSVHERIVDKLRKKPCKLSEIGKALSMSYNAEDIKIAIEELLDRGEVEESVDHNGKGRPATIYSLERTPF